MVRFHSNCGHRYRGTISFMPGMLAALCLVGMTCISSAAQPTGSEIHSNGSGGGRWSESSTWHGGQVPSAADMVVIGMRDVVEFDLDDHSGDSCAALFLDPEAVLEFRPGRDDRTLSVGGIIESYGAIRLDGTADRRARLTLRLTSDDAAGRRIILREYSSLLAYGHEVSGDEPNVSIVSEEGPATLVADGRVMLDLHRTRIVNLRLNLANLDNSGGANERLNLIDNRFRGANVQLAHCDSPMLRGNHFELGEPPLPAFALSIENCAMVQLVETTVAAGFRTGVRILNDTSSNIVDLAVEGARSNGVIVRGSTDTSLRGLRVDGADGSNGIVVHSSKCIFGDVAVSGFMTGFEFRQAQVQMADCSVAAVPDGKGRDVFSALRLDGSSVRLINSTIAPHEVRTFGRDLPPDGEGYIEALQYLVVQANPSGGRRGDVFDDQDLPRGLRVRVHTAAQSGGVPAGRADLNVRNSPMPFSSRGLTALASSRRAMVVRSWRFDRNGDLHQAPFYDLFIEAPAEDGSYEVLVEKVIEPTAEWFRADLNSAVPTVEVNLP